MTPCSRDALLDLADRRLDPQEEREVQAHVAACADCRGQLQLERLVREDARAVQATRVDAAMRDRLWQALQPVAEAAAAQQRQRAAWRLVLDDRRLRRTVAVLCLLTAATAVSWMATRSLVASPGPETASLRETQVAPPDVADSPVPNQPLALLQAWAEPVRAAEPRPDQPPAPASLAHNHGHAHTPPGTLRLACGAVVEVGAAHVEIVRNQLHSAEFAVTRGRVGVHLAHPGPGATLLVRTADVAIHVKGTRFTVDKSSADATEVHVQEGSVWLEPHGRGREWKVLHAGQSERILGESAWLRGLMADLDDAIGDARLETAQDLTEQYLDAADEGAESDEVRLRLAGIYQRMNKLDDAARLYRGVADGQGQTDMRDNALAMLAWSCRQRGRNPLEQATWQQYVERFPQGLHAREAMVRLVELTCGQSDDAADRVRQTLQERFGADSSAVDILGRCQAKSL